MLTIRSVCISPSCNQSLINPLCADRDKIHLFILVSTVLILSELTQAIPPSKQPDKDIAACLESDPNFTGRDD